MNYRIYVLSFFLCFYSIVPVSGNNMKGTEFWLGFMENHPYPTGTGTYVSINSAVNTTGTIQVPGANWSQNFSVNANSSIEIQLPTALVTNSGNMITANTGVYIQTQDSVYIALMNDASGTADATGVLPLYALGYDYFATTYIDPPNTNWGTPEVLVVATEDNTVVQLTPSGLLSNQQNIPVSVVLNKGQCYQIQSYWTINQSQHQGNDLSGTRIESVCNNNGIKHPIAVFSGNRCTIVGGVNCSGCDHLVEQLNDFHTWGQQFVVVPPENRNNYKLKVVAAYNNTTISGNGIPAQNLNSGQAVELNLSGDRFLISTLPVSVALITYGQGCSPGYGDPMMSFIPPVAQMSSDWHYQSFDDGSTLYLNYLTVVTNTANTNNVYLDNALLPAAGFSVFVPNPTFSWTRIPMPAGTIPHQISSSGGFQAFPHGYTGAASYYINSGLSVPNLEPNFDIGYLQDTTNHIPFNDTICACEPVAFMASYYDTTTTLDWDFGDGNNGQGFNVTHSYLNGTFDVTLILRDASGCAFDTLTKQNLVVVNCDISMSSLDTLCIGDSVTLTANTGSSFIWNTGATTSSIIVSPVTTTSYSLQIDGGNTPICDSIIVYVYPPYDIGLDDSLWFCETDTAIVNATTGLNSYTWSDNSTQSYLQAQMSGLYWLIVQDTNGCFATDSVEVIMGSIPVWDLGPDMEACDGDTVNLLGPVVSGAQFVWSTQETTSNISVSQTGEYILVVDDNVCITKDTVAVQFNNPPVTSLPTSFYLCETELLLEPTPGTMVDYYWSTGETTTSIIVTESGIYWVDMDNNCGSATDTVEVVFDCSFSMYVPNAFSPDGDGINDVFQAKGVGVVKFDMRIFNRWGEQIFHSTSLDQHWDGIYQNKRSQIDTYIWVVQVQDVLGRHHDFKGHVTVVR
jgi:gliding motility-associated-like protein